MMIFRLFIGSDCLWRSKPDIRRQVCVLYDSLIIHIFNYFVCFPLVIFIVFDHLTNNVKNNITYMVLNHFCNNRIKY